MINQIFQWVIENPMLAIPIILTVLSVAWGWLSNVIQGTAASNKIQASHPNPLTADELIAVSKCVELSYPQDGESESDWKRAMPGRLESIGADLHEIKTSSGIEYFLCTYKGCLLYTSDAADE